MSGSKLIKAFRGANGPNSVLAFEVIDHDGKVVPEPFLTATHAKLYLYGNGIVVDSQVDLGAIDWSLGGGKIELNLGGVDVTAGSYRARLVVFGPNFPDGYVLTHETGPNYLIVQFV